MKKTLTFKPPHNVASAAKEGLRLRKKFGRGATLVGLARGRQLSARKPVSFDVIKRMYSYFSRHNVDKQGKNFFNPEKPSNGYIAWMLWGGDAGAEWSYKVRDAVKREYKVCSRGHVYKGSGGCPVCWKGNKK